MHSRRLRLAGDQPLSLVMNFTHTACPRFLAPLQLFHCPFSEPRLVVARKIKPAPHLKVLRIFLIPAKNVIKLRARGHRQHDRLLDSDLIHILDPLLNFPRRLRIRMRVHIDRRKFSPRNLRNRSLVNGLWPVVFQQNGFR